MYLKLKPFCLYFAALLILGCSQPKIKDANKKLINDHFKFLNAHNVAGLRGQFADSGFVSSPDMQSEHIGAQGADQVFHYIFVLSTDVQFLVKNVSVTDSGAVVRYEARGTKSRDSVANSFFDYNGCAVFKIKDAKIDSEFIYNNPSRGYVFVGGRMMPTNGTH